MNFTWSIVSGKETTQSPKGFRAIIQQGNYPEQDTTLLGYVSDYEDNLILFTTHTELDVVKRSLEDRLRAMEVRIEYLHNQAPFRRGSALGDPVVVTGGFVRLCVTFLDTNAKLDLPVCSMTLRRVSQNIFKEYPTTRDIPGLKMTMVPDWFKGEFEQVVDYPATLTMP